MKMTVTRIHGGGYLLAHDPERCAGQYCCIHNPSDHHMKEWDQEWREDDYKMERVCKHGIGHPDPDHVSYMLRIGASSQCDLVHGCDGCCMPNPSARP